MKKKTKSLGILYIVSTPIGNLKDITYRAIEILKTVNIIAAESINHTKKLLNFYKIKTKITSFNKENEKAKSYIILKKLIINENIAIVSNSGTPLINDPGELIVKMCHKNKIKVVPIPGACSAIAAISSSGISTKKFCYEGFIPRKEKKIENMFYNLYLEKRTIILLETSKRILKSLNIIMKIFGKNRKITFIKEVTKFWETIKKTRINKLIKWIKLDKKRYKGEILLIIEGNTNLHQKVITYNILETHKILKKFLMNSSAIIATSKIHNINKNLLYKYILKNKMT
ncbi:16S rRNA (cytidine(1402)-2'-O)-methyltransferase [Buchnera aphidicola (Chaitoregma tattakana)]|uniref:16S rRNA (cytidine(1402)-2'-O)-methyltransferase n=1 Tax=Buchnera aphidicola TaxID=9 RepID=UPI0031B87297